MMRIALLVAGITLVQLGMAQQGEPPKHAAPPKVVAAGGLITTGEASVVCGRVRDSIQRVLLVKNVKSLPGAPGNLTRAQLINVMADWVAATRPKWVLTLPKLPVESRYIKGLDAKTTETLKKLIAQGFVARQCVLTSGTKPGLTPEEFGDMLGYFICRLGEYTHQPSSKYSPALMKQ
ncbi:MAG: hypothetical protein JST35_03275 [Armatimonadetes bacterium]|nr:hypothetical protein [Armatimonadota bacterium]